MEFGGRLRDLRKQNNLTQKQLADLIGVKNSIISFYEVGDRFPSPEIIIKLAAVLHTSTDYLLGVEKGRFVDITGLDAEDEKVVRIMVERLREKNQYSK
ncbi:MAG: helix-turn-helix transcriptional regulator [Ruminiclostridium sp.]|nr:helix-turn-helix transcriptional regulator [Ruminiclostridium sp.]